MLQETLDSLHTQSYPNLEILLLDNACSPEGQQTLERYASRDPRARVLRSEQRLSMWENFNRGVQAAAGDYVVFFHDDDVYLPHFIAREVEMLEAHPEAGFVGCNYYQIDEAGRPIGLRRHVKATGVMPGRDYIRGLIWRVRNIITTPSIMFRRTLIAAIPPDEALPANRGDAVMLMRMAEVADVALIAEPLLQKRIHLSAASISAQPSQTIPLRTRLFRDYIAEYARRWPDDRVFVRSLQRGLERSHVVGLIWAWTVARDAAEAEACRLELRKTSMGRPLSYGFAALDRLGLSPHRRRATLVPLLQRVGRVVPS
jgi:glycosyltransferase involved in cell wall biosynthesis